MMSLSKLIFLQEEKKCQCKKWRRYISYINNYTSLPHLLKHTHDTSAAAAAVSPFQNINFVLLYIDHVTGKAITWLMTVKKIVFLLRFACRHAKSSPKVFFWLMRIWIYALASSRLQVADNNKLLICESRRESETQWSVICASALQIAECKSI